MLARTLAIAAVALGLTLTATAQQTSPTLLTQAVAATQTARAEYAFDFELETSQQNWRARYEPSASPRLRLVQPRRDELGNDERRAFDRMAEDMEGVSWCASENIARVEQVRLLREDDTTATYAFQPTAESVRGDQARRFADRLRGEMTIQKSNPDISRVRLYVPTAFSPLPLVRLDHLNIVITCAVAPNGRRYAAETVTTMRGSALGQDFDERTIQRARNLSAS